MRYYSATAGAMSLTAGISSSDTSITLDTVVGLPSSFPFSLVLDPGQATEEIVQVTAAAGSTLTVSRGFDGTSAQTHSLGATVRHMMIPADLREPQQHLAATSAHGVSGDVVGTTDVQDLSNKRAVAANKDTPGLVVKGAASQAADYYRVEDNAGATVAKASPNAAWSTGPVEMHNSGGASLFKRAFRSAVGAADVVAGIFKAAASQSADILQVQDSSGAVLAKFDKDGNLTAPNYSDSGVLTTGVVTAATGFTVTLQRARKVGKVAYLYVEMTSTNAFAAGDVANTDIATLATGWGSDYIAGVSNGATGPVWSGYINSSREVKLTATATGIPAGGPISFSATYLTN